MTQLKLLLSRLLILISMFMDGLDAVTVVIQFHLSLLKVEATSLLLRLELCSREHNTPADGDGAVDNSQ